MKYTVDYFIESFQAIPENKWLVRDYGDLVTTGCVMGHCHLLNRGHNDIRFSLGKLFKHHSSLFTPLDKCLTFGNGHYEQSVNNGDDPNYQQSTPKERILAALYDIKKMQQPEYPDITKELAVLPEDKTETDLIKMKNPRIFT